MLHEAVLERVVRHHDDAPADRGGLDRSRQGALKNLEFAVDGDAERLESALRGVGARRARGGGDARADKVDELDRCA